ncbi:SRPBCC family protein [Flexithrix dorotheae]|uniref:SRPBCC family protein n=1 Tax=Flexithrix dorotheae TaxID=70993 RepID=UPI0003663470|nr:SRPBCC domain-containing protein [Flexithrix dorotheae]
MKNTKFTANKNVLTVTRTFQAPVNLVWRAWTEADLLDQWWAPKPWKSQTKSMNFKTGGQRLYAMVGPEGEEHWGLTTYNQIQTGHSFTGEDAFCDKEGIVNNSLPVAQFDNQFLDEAANTTVIVTTKYASEEHLQQVIQMGMKEGLSMAYDNLDGVLKNLS